MYTVYGTSTEYVYMFGLLPPSSCYQVTTKLLNPNSLAYCNFTSYLIPFDLLRISQNDPEKGALKTRWENWM